MYLTKSTVIALALAMFSNVGIAKISAEDVARLGKDLNPIGGIKAGSEDKLIPTWTGSVTGLPAGLEWDGPGTPYPNPWPQEQPLFVISKDNLEQYRDRLSPGQLAMFETYRILSGCRFIPDTANLPSILNSTRRFSTTPKTAN